MSLIEPTTIYRLTDRHIGSPEEVAPAGSRREARDGSVLWWGKADTPGPPKVVSAGLPTPITVAVSPVRPGHTVAVEYRSNGGPVRQTIAVPVPGPHNAPARLFRALLPGQPSGLVDFLPVLRFAGQPISPRLTESADYPRYQVGGAAPGVAPPGASAGSSGTPAAELAGEPRWDWDTKFLWTITVTVRKEVVGAVPDGLRINWHLKEGWFVGPGHEGVVLPGASDWMRIRKDGVGIVDVKELLQTRTGARLYCSYGGTFNLGEDGYARAQRDEFDPLPPFVAAPTYATADKELAWLNRVQCIGVGRVYMKPGRLEYDVYVVRVGGRKHAG
jgi:hypothetical protein